MNKNIKIFINYFLGPVLFAWLVYSIYRQIASQSQLQDSWNQIKASFSSYKIFYLVGAILLIPVNWGLEALKWKYSVSFIYPISKIQAFKAVLSGISFSITMPNRIGEYVGRVIYMPEGQRLRTISATMVGSFAQLMITISLGTLGLIVLKNALINSFHGFVIWYQFIIYGLTALTFILFLLYFNIAGSVGFFRHWIKKERYLYLVEALRNFNVQLLVRLILISIIRYGVFILQYMLIFYLFDVNLPWGIIASVMSMVFLAMAIVPSIALLEVGLRGGISIKIMGIFTTNSLGIGLTSVTVWFINLILPAIIGSLLIVNLKVFNKRNEII